MADMEVGSPPAGTHGTQYQSNPAASRFYGTQYQADDFHAPDCTIGNYADRRQVQACKLSGLPDLNTGKADVQTELRGYLQALIDAGVKGFRVDGAKHMAAHDIAAIFERPNRQLLSFFRRCHRHRPASGCATGSTPPDGDVTEFAYSVYAIGAASSTTRATAAVLSDLQNRSPRWNDMLPTRFAQVFSGQPRQPARPRPGARRVHRGSPRRPGASCWPTSSPWPTPTATRR
jgi:glycosidase